MEENSIYVMQYSDINKGETRIFKATYVSLLTIIKMGTKIHNKLRILRFEIKVIYYRSVFTLYKSFSVTKIDSTLVF